MSWQVASLVVLGARPGRRLRAGTSATSRPRACWRWWRRSPRWRWSAGSPSPRSRTSSRPPTSCCSPATRSARCRASWSARSPRSCRTSSSRRAPGPPGRWPAGAPSASPAPCSPLALRGREPSRFLLAGRLRARRARLRRLDGPLPAHARGPPGPRLLPGAVRQLAALQPRPRDRKRGVLPLDRTRLHPRAAPLPPPPRGALAARPPGAAATLLLALAAGRPPPRSPRRPPSAPSAGLREPRTRTAASAPPRARRRAALYSGWAGARPGRRPATTRATCTGAAGARWPPTSRATGARSRTSARSSARSSCSSAAGLSPRDFGGQRPGRGDPRASAAATARSRAT